MSSRSSETSCFDLPLLRLVGFSAAPRNARAEVKHEVDYVTKMDGGNGAVREVIELIIAHQRPRSAACWRTPTCSPLNYGR